MTGWRYFARRVSTDGGQGDVLHGDLPLTGAGITDALSAGWSLDATIQPVFGTLLADDKRPLLEEWGSEIWAVKDGRIMGGGIVTHSAFGESGDWQIECSGYASYPHGMPFTDAIYYVETDVFDIIRGIWSHLQSQPRGNLGVEVGVDASGNPVMSGVKIGKDLQQDQFDPGGDDSLTFESGPYKLSWYDTADLGQNIDDLAGSTPFEFRERHEWSGSDIRHFIDLAHPRIGRRRPDLRFVVGENVVVVPSVENVGDDYANEILGLGAGDGRTMVRGYAAVDDGKLRRVVVVEDKTAKDKKAIGAVSNTALAWRNRLGDIASIVVTSGGGSIEVGDEIRLTGDADWNQLDSWQRVISRTISPDSGDMITLNLLRADKVGLT